MVAVMVLEQEAGSKNNNSNFDNDTYFGPSVTVPVKEILGLRSKNEGLEATIEKLKSELTNSADANLKNAVAQAEPLDKTTKDITYQAFMTMKSYLGANKNKHKLGLSVFILDPKQASSNLYNNDGNDRILSQFEEQPTVYKGFSKVLDLMVNEDYAIIINKHTGVIEMAKAKLIGDTRIADPDDLYNDAFNARCSTAVAASYFGTSVTLRNSNKQLFAMHNGEVVYARVPTVEGGFVQAPLNYVPEGSTDTIPQKQTEAA